MDSFYAFMCKRFRDAATQQHLEHHCKALFWNTLFVYKFTVPTMIQKT
jgi:hypothetical protein